MENKVISLSAARSAPKPNWLISVLPDARPKISCYYNDDHMCWAGLVTAPSLDELPKVMGAAMNAMRTAQKQRRPVEVSL